MTTGGGEVLALHVSDLHFGTELQAAQQALQAFALAQRPGLLIASGDLTQRARPQEFAALRDYLPRLHIPELLAVPGNHDLPVWNPWQRLTRPYEAFETALRQPAEPRWAQPRLWVAGLRSTRRWRHRHGQISRTQVTEAAAWLQRAPAGALRVVVAHHPAWVQRPQDQVHRFRGADAALRCWAEAGVHLVLGGHLHRPFLAWHRPAGASRGLWVAQAGSALSRRRAAGQALSVNVLRALPDGDCQLERWDCGGARFELIERRSLRV